MARYLIQASYTPEAWAGMIRNPQNRREAVAPLIEALGGRLVSLDFAFGEYDIVVILEVPDNIGATAGAMAVTASGAFKAYKTTPLISAEEAMQAASRAGEAAASYRPPTSGSA